MMMMSLATQVKMKEYPVIMDLYTAYASTAHMDVHVHYLLSYAQYNVAHADKDRKWR